MYKWESQDLEGAKEHLGMRITRDHSKWILKLDQITYAQKVIDCFDIQNCRPSYVPLPTQYNFNSSIEESNPQLQSHYQSVIGSLFYIMLGTQPDLAYSVIKMSQFSGNPTEDHLKQPLYIIHYLTTTRDLYLTVLIRECQKTDSWHIVIWIEQEIWILRDQQQEIISFLQTELSYGYLDVKGYPLFHQSRICWNDGSCQVTHMDQIPVQWT